MISPSGKGEGNKNNNANNCSVYQYQIEGKIQTEKESNRRINCLVSEISGIAPDSC